jgi:dihydroneopterin aldolase
VTGGSTDRVRVTGLRAVGRHGVLPEEQVRPQPFVLDIELAVDLSAAGASDDLDDTVDYAAAASQAVAVVERESHALIERVATRVCDELLVDERVTSVTVEVHKPKAPLGLDAAEVSVVVTRTRPS